MRIQHSEHFTNQKLQINCDRWGEDRGGGIAHSFRFWINSYITFRKPGNLRTPGLNKVKRLTEELFTFCVKKCDIQCMYNVKKTFLSSKMVGGRTCITWLLSARAKCWPCSGWVATMLRRVGSDAVGGVTGSTVTQIVLGYLLLLNKPINTH